MPPPDTTPLLQLPNTFRIFYGTFTGLHRIQSQAIEPILANRDLILQSATGSGKTEAVLAPCLEGIIASNKNKSALYIVPTRALAFDIRRRFAGLLKDRLGIRMAIRTGDMKSSGGGRPDIILTTPESLDVMLGSANVDLQAFLLRVHTIIIDEVHPFIHQYRGRQLFYLMQRLERRTGKCLQKIALSATIADPNEVCRFLHFQSDYVLLTDTVRRDIHPRIIHLKDDEDELISLVSDLSGEWKYRKILIFANSRGRCDKIFGLLNRQGAFKGLALLHYSNLNTRERQTVEQQFRQQARAVCVATSTLELGIDVGDVDAVLLFEPPDSVSAFLQRIGRANRRRNTIHFWGICRGGRAGEQVLRFLALLRLAAEGKVESALSDKMPSVLSQQFLSCLYEKKRLTLAALQDLFPSHSDEETEQIFSALIKKNWLKKTVHKGLFSGAYHYWHALLEYRIWSNFPENEDQYQLLVGDESVADIPKSVVRQIEPGDRVLLAGRRLKILWLDAGEIKRVVAESSRTVDDKELVWLGKGSQVSYEVAQAMRMVLKSQSTQECMDIPGLFSRSRELLRQELEKDSRAVVLDNSIEVVRLANGSYQYRTFIGAVGNLILAASIKDFFAGQEEDIAVTSDEIGLICSVQVRFDKLILPLTEDAFSSWITRHFKMMAAMFPLNAFCSTLPRELLCLELTGFIRDHRLLSFFKRCRNSRSAIVAGDPVNLNLQALVTPEKVTQEIPSQSEPLLNWDKKRRTNTLSPLFPPDTVFQPGALTGTIIGEYFRHQQCERWLSLHFFQTKEQQLFQTPKNDTSISCLRLAKGIAFEKKVISHLQGLKKIFGNIAAKDADGQIRSMNERFAETMSCLDQISRQPNSGSSYIVQPVLRIDSALSVTQQLPLPGVGIPDLIQLRQCTEKQSVFLQVGDIKSSSQPRYYQKWQVAFYAWLLLQLTKNRSHFTVADSGFILTPSGDGNFARRHVFDLTPYLTSMEAVLKNLQTVLDTSPWQTFWQLQKHCISCAGFEFCYQQAASEEDIQFIPGISRGVLQKMRSLGVKTLQQKMDVQNVFTFRQQKTLQNSITALYQNTILIEGKDGKSNKSDLFPSNISTFFTIHLVVEPVSGQIQSIGLLIHRKDREPETINWRADTESEQDLLWDGFSSRLAQLWHDAIENSRGPHLLLFGQATRLAILKLAEHKDDSQMKALFSSGENCHYTDLQQLLTCHFSLPLPGTMTLFGLNRILVLMPAIKLPAPESLFHEDKFHEIGITTICQLIYKVWQWINSHLKSRWHKDEWRLLRQTDFHLSNACLEFIEAERVHHQRDIANLMELTLAERVERSRALGPLDFTGTSLDEEGKFIYLFSRSSIGEDLADKTQQNIPAKFRSGDFLKLVPLGISDLQSGLPVIMERFNSQTGEVSLYPRKRGDGIFKEIKYSLEEDGEDYHSAKVRDVVQKAFTDDNYQLTDLFGGTYTHTSENIYDKKWLQGWLHSEAAVANLNPSQQQALQLPFQHALSLISGPPGTGKTHLLGWILIALIRQAQNRGTPLRIAVSALTHKAIDQVLNKLIALVNSHGLPDFPVRCLKWGRWEGTQFDPDDSKMQVEPCRDAIEIFSSPYLVVGATGYGLYSMLHKQGGTTTPDTPFDWIIFDEASQILIPQALLSLVHGKGNFLFLGDVCQLPPIIRSKIFPNEGTEDDDSFTAQTRSSVLEVLLKHYPRQNQLLNITYRMNDAICRFPSRTWYKGQLLPDTKTAGKRLSLTASAKYDLFDEIINPEKPVVLVGINHSEWSETAGMEADLLARISHRLLKNHDLQTEQIAILSPHRVQNNSIAGCLADLLGHDDLPVIDTVERMQGAERDVILFGFSCSDPDQIFSEFLNNPNRFNVVLTRARTKLIVVGSTLFFESVALTEKQLHANACFKDFFRHCRENDCYFEYSEQD
ncbi:MAG: AAA domain-containing protein [Thermodesulfobacteriota bacterium]|nr:AAA domain-containing protein [Thermodesulfobacteriota bacterium]